MLLAVNLAKLNTHRQDCSPDVHITGLRTRTHSKLRMVLFEHKYTFPQEGGLSHSYCTGKWAKAFPEILPPTFEASFFYT